jgi:hypothetical protein
MCTSARAKYIEQFSPELPAAPPPPPTQAPLENDHRCSRPISHPGTTRDYRESKLIVPLPTSDDKIVAD